MPPANVEVPEPTLMSPPIYASPDVSRMPSVVVAFPTPNPPDINASDVAPFLPMAREPISVRILAGEEVPKPMTPLGLTYMKGELVPVSATTNTGLEAGLVVPCSIENVPQGVEDPMPTKRLRTEVPPWVSPYMVRASWPAMRAV